MFILLFFIFLIVLLICFLLFPYLKRSRDDIGLLPNEIDAYKFKKGTSNLLFSANAIHLAMNDIIESATKEILFSTYRWRVELNNDCVMGAIIEIGKALTQLALRSKQKEETIIFKIMTNQVLWSESNNFVKDHISKTYSVWKTLGFEPSSPGVVVEFKTWQHVSLGNIHDKFLVVDGQRAIIHSSNVEGYSHGAEGSWVETGVYIEDEVSSSQLRDHFLSNFEKCTAFRFKQTAEKDFSFKYEGNFKPQGSEDLKDSVFIENDSLQKETEILVCSNIPQPFACGRRNPIMMMLLPLLQHAKSHVCFTTPNFNDICIFNSLVKNTQIKARVLLAKEFNVDVPFIQEKLLGWSTNERALPIFKNNNIEFRWNVYNGKPVVGKTSGVVHSKMIIIDDEYIIVGSLNCDLFSTISSGETVCVLKSQEQSMLAKKKFFEPLWENAVVC